MSIRPLIRRPVREAIEQYRGKLDANPFVTVERALFEAPENNMGLEVCHTIANYIGGEAQDIALMQNTTTGLSRDLPWAAVARGR